LENQLKDKTIKAIGWSSIEKISFNLVKFFIGIILARLLMPADYGLVGMLSIFISIALVLVDSGFGNALIQKKYPEAVDYSTILVFNIFIGVLGYLAIFFSAKAIAGFYNTPQLILITRVFGLIILINALSVIPITVLKKNLDFKTQTKVSVISVIISGVVGILMAYKGFGVWALIFQTLTRDTLKALLLWTFSKFKFDLKFSFPSLKGLFSYGSKLLLAGLIDAIFVNIYYVIIAKIYSSATLGYFSRARHFMEMSVLSLNEILTKVTFPVFALIQDDEDKLKRVYRKTIKLIAFFTFPFLLGLVVVADPFIRVLLTEKWLPVVPMLRLLCISGMIYPLQSLNLNLIKAKGKSALFLWLEIIQKVLISIAIVLTYKQGVMSLIYGQVIVSLFSYLLNAILSGRIIHYYLLEQFNDLMPIMLITIISAGAAFGIKFFVGENYTLLLIGQILLCTILYLSLSKIVHIDIYAEIKEEVKNRLPVKYQFLINIF
jgi:teichuronic acid exporter